MFWHIFHGCFLFTRKIRNSISQQTFFCSKLTIQTLGKCVEYVQVNVNDLILVSFLLSLNIFHTFFSVSVADFELVNVYWVKRQIHRKYVCINIFKPLKGRVKRVTTTWPTTTWAESSKKRPRYILRNYMKIKSSINAFFSKWKQIHSFLRICSERS